MEGDKDLFRQIVDAHSGMIFSVLYRVTSSREDAEDLAQETFVKAYFLDLEQITGMTQANVKVRLFRCRNRLARMLKTDKDLEK